MGKWWFFRNLNDRRTVKSILLVKKLLELVEMTSGLVIASFSSPKWQAVKMIFVAPWDGAIQHLNSWCQLLFNLPTLRLFFELKQMKWIIFWTVDVYTDMNMNMTFAVKCTFFQLLFQPLRWLILLWRSCSLLYCILYWCKAPYASPLWSFCPQVIWPRSFSPLSNLLHCLKNKIYHMF